MVEPPFELPELITFCGDWETYLAEVYEAFCTDFVASKPVCGAKRCALKRHPLTQGKEATFWHLISEGAVEDDRLPDLRRCERIRWPRCLMEAAGSAAVYCWEQRRSERRIAIATIDFDYVVIVADRGEYVLPWTAFPVEQEHRRRRLQAEWVRDRIDGCPW